MRRFLILLAVLFVGWGCASTVSTKPQQIPQQEERLSILGDSYSTFEGYVQPASNNCWYGLRLRPTMASSTCHSATSTSNGGTPR